MTFLQRFLVLVGCVSALVGAQEHADTLARQYQQQLQSLQQQLQSLEGSLHSLNAKYMDLEKTHVETRQSLSEDCQVRVQNAATAQRQELSDQVSRLQSEHAAQLQDLQDRVAALPEELESTKTQCASIQSQLQGEIQALVTQQQDSVLEERKKWQDAQATLADENDKLKTSLKKLQDEVDSIHKANAKTRADLLETKQDVLDLENAAVKSGWDLVPSVVVDTATATAPYLHMAKEQLDYAGKKAGPAMAAWWKLTREQSSTLLQLYDQHAAPHVQTASRSFETQVQPKLNQAFKPVLDLPQTQKALETRRTMLKSASSALESASSTVLNKQKLNGADDQGILYTTLLFLKSHSESIVGWLETLLYAFLVYKLVALLFGSKPKSMPPKQTPARNAKTATKVKVENGTTANTGKKHRKKNK